MAGLADWQKTVGVSKVDVPQRRWCRVGIAIVVAVVVVDGCLAIPRWRVLVDRWWW